MIVIIGLLVLAAAVGVAVMGVASNTGHALGDSFVIFGQHLHGLSSGQLFLYGIAVGVVGMLGLSMLLGAFTRRMASRRSRRALRDSQRETAVVREDRDRLVQRIDVERTDRLRAEPTGAGDAPGAEPGRFPPVNRHALPPE